DALAALEGHSWPGNIRELENVLERTILFTKGDRIERADLQLAGANDPPHAAPAAAPNSGPNSGPIPALGDDDDDDAGEAPGSQSGSLKDIVRAETSRVERELIVKALDETGGNVTQAARLLKISRKSLQMKMKEFGLRDKEA
ncbi:MAG TPA: helix-turn-helix domain-containing protein, partial [Kofleriaceae bacterium]|nr:helix-turn-helix domain-containing protein [Kofleriaceae bacterium]